MLPSSYPEGLLRTIAATSLDPAILGPICIAFPNAELLHLSIEQVERSPAHHRLGALVVDHLAFSDQGASRLAVLKATFPWLAVIAWLPADHPQLIAELVRSRIDAVLVAAGIEDHPEHVCQVFTDAANSSVAHAVEHACQPAPPWLAAGNIARAVASIGKIKRPTALATALGQTAAGARSDMHAVGPFQMRVLLSVLRVTAASRRLGDSLDPIKRIARDVGYGSVVSLHHAFEWLLKSTPQDIRKGGGLWHAGERLHATVEAMRAAGGGAASVT